MIAIIDYNSGNLRSVQKACKHVGADCKITFDATEIRRAERIIFPGVGRAEQAMRALRKNGLDTLIKAAYLAGTPMLVICVGAQLILDYSEEDETCCLGLIAGIAKKFAFPDNSLKIPHMGWNQIKSTQAHPLLAHFRPKDECYFANAYYPVPTDKQHCYATSEYGGDFCSALGAGSLFATQFHPEKSGRAGLALLSAFADWDGRPALPC